MVRSLTTNDNEPTLSERGPVRHVCAKDVIHPLTKTMYLRLLSVPSHNLNHHFCPVHIVTLDNTPQHFGSGGASSRAGGGSSRWHCREGAISTCLYTRRRRFGRYGLLYHTRTMPVPVCPCCPGPRPGPRGRCHQVGVGS